MKSIQPTPQVTQYDVERIVRREFPEESFQEVMALLNQYGSMEWQREPHRVRLAALKTSKGKLLALRRQIDLAKRDYRDVIACAEYPGYTQNLLLMRELSDAERQKIIEQDWKQYERWLNRIDSGTEDAERSR